MNNHQEPKQIILIPKSYIPDMPNEKCTFFSAEKCTACDLEPCDFSGDTFEKCLRYKLHFLRPQLMQLR
ncbi:Uncharacterised protein [uncultured archaeon]|nr:Uncharacterised protein [uncultured archaeon]